MNPITVRNLPPAVAKAVRAKARREHLSLNRAVVELLTEAVAPAGPASAPASHHDLDRFFGSWTRAEAGRFDRALKGQRTIDPEMWK